MVVFCPRGVEEDPRWAPSELRSSWSAGLGADVRRAPRGFSGFAVRGFARSNGPPAAPCPAAGQPARALEGAAVPAASPSYAQPRPHRLSRG